MQASKLYDRANQMASDSFGACRTVAAFSLRGEIFTLYSHLLEAPEKAARKRFDLLLTEERIHSYIW